MKFKIFRKKWYRGRGTDNSKLLRSRDKKMCCVGMFCRQLGVPDMPLRNVCSVGDILETAEKNKLKGVLVTEGMAEVAWLTKAYETNDSIDIDNTEREEQLTTLLAAHGHQLQFIG